MIGIAALIVLMIAGSGFYGWFLLALCKEAGCFKTCYLVRLEVWPDEVQIFEKPEMSESAPIAA